MRNSGNGCGLIVGLVCPELIKVQRKMLNSVDGLMGIRTARFRSLDIIVVGA